MKDFFKRLDSSIVIWVVCSVAVVIAFFVILLVSVQQQNEIMQQQHCYPNGMQRTYFQTQFTYGTNGMISGTIIIPVTEYYYVCDDYPRWR